jgi:hypothetical protein
MEGSKGASHNSEEVSIPEIVWLDLHGGRWHLMTRNANDRVRKWTNQERALSDLTAEGWIVDAPHGRKPTMKHSGNGHFYRYALKRTVH